MKHTIKVDEQGKLYWVKDWPEKPWTEEIEKAYHSGNLSALLMHDLETMQIRYSKSVEQALSTAIEIADSSLIAAEHSIVTYIPGIYTIEADGRFEVKGFCKACTSLGHGIRHCAHPEECGEWVQLAYWITDKHEEK